MSRIQKFHTRQELIPMIRKSIGIVRVTFYYALRDLFREIELLDELKTYPHLVLSGDKIPGEIRAVQDRFAKVCQDLRMTSEEIEESREKIFFSWKDWTQYRDDESRINFLEMP